MFSIRSHQYVYTSAFMAYGKWPAVWGERGDRSVTVTWSWHFKLRLILLFAYTNSSIKCRLLITFITWYLNNLFKRRRVSFINIKFSIWSYHSTYVSYWRSMFKKSTWNFLSGRRRIGEDENLNIIQKTGLLDLFSIS